MISSLVVWILATSLIFNYIVNVLHPEETLGEPIWVIDPIGFLIISVPTGVVFLVGVVAVFGSMLKNRK